MCCGFSQQSHTNIKIHVFVNLHIQYLTHTGHSPNAIQADIIVPDYRNVEKICIVISYFLATLSFSILPCSSCPIFQIFFSNKMSGIKLQLKLYTYPNVESVGTSITFHLSIHDSVLKISTH